ncbi:MAG: hypothetical protein LBV61_08880 [Burkholderiaceae bacterium]|jgi:hypothetical protein|nr:hypothetical protein [Burkholderiaceae bacterium]
MKPSRLLMLPAVATLAFALAAFAMQAQGRVWRCPGNKYTNDTYTNNTARAQRQGCRAVEGGNLSVVQDIHSATMPSADPSSSAARAPAASPRIDSAEQRTRDDDARAILESELHKAQTRQSQLLQAYNGGQPEKQGSEAKNYQKYLDRVSGMKAQIDRNQSDIDSIRRELSRLGPAPAADSAGSGR